MGQRSRQTKRFWSKWSGRNFWTKTYFSNCLTATSHLFTLFFLSEGPSGPTLFSLTASLPHLLFLLFSSYRKDLTDQNLFLQLFHCHISPFYSSLFTGRTLWTETFFPNCLTATSHILLFSYYRKDLMDRNLFP